MCKNWLCKGNITDWSHYKLDTYRVICIHENQNCISEFVLGQTQKFISAIRWGVDTQMKCSYSCISRKSKF